MVLSLGERGQAALFVVVLIVAIAGLYATTQAIQPALVTSDVVHLARLEIKASTWTIHYAPNATTNNTPFGLLREASSRLGFSLSYVPYEIPKGVFVTAINGSVNGDGGRYWQYWVDGTYGAVAADYLALHDGDEVQWTFSAGVEGG